MKQTRQMKHGMDKFRPTLTQKIWRDILYYLPEVIHELCSALTFVALVAFAIRAASSRGEQLPGSSFYIILSSS